MQAEKVGIFRAAACNNGYISGIKTLMDQKTDHFAGCRRIGAWFQDGGVSGCNGIDQRFNGEKERIVPWTHNENDAIGRWFAETAGVELCQRSWYGFFFCVRADIFQHMCDLGEHQSGFTHIALEIAFSQVFSESSMDLCFVFSDGGTEAFQGADTEIEI